MFVIFADHFQNRKLANICIALFKFNVDWEITSYVCILATFLFLQWSVKIANNHKKRYLNVLCFYLKLNNEKWLDNYVRTSVANQEAVGCCTMSLTLAWPSVNIVSRNPAETLTKCCLRFLQLHSAAADLWGVVMMLVTSHILHLKSREICVGTTSSCFQLGFAV